MKYRRTDDHRQNNLTDEKWLLIEPMIPKQGRMGRSRKTDPRRTFDAIRYMLASGCQWRLLRGSSSAVFDSSEREDDGRWRSFRP